MKSIAVSACITGASVGNAHILQGIDLQIASARWTSVVGPNGAGKSTLLKVLAGVLHPGRVQGDVHLLGQPLAHLPARQRARQLAWLGQNESSADDLTAYAVAMLGRMPHQRWMAPPSAADHAAVQAALRTTQAWEWRHRPLSQLSGGERQRVLLARALAVQAQVLLMDEPLAHLDPPHQSDWLHTVRTLVAGGGTVVSVLHEISMALQADDMVVMAAGRVVHHGPCAAPQTHAALEQVFDDRIQVRQVDDQWIALPRIDANANANVHRASRCAAAPRMPVKEFPVKERPHAD
ncbi:MAG: ABC transporter ATP-binding protein [Comamonadaceae bacterium]|nr:MAG: ABC transporter ATP-binding protein [Comamonadaceae bacterium]